MGKDADSGIQRFVDDYRRVRLSEGLASADPEFARQLPFRDTTGRNDKLWRTRALHYLVVRGFLALFPRAERVLDVGAGNGWMSRRLAGAHRVTAVDVDATDTGLKALADEPRVRAARAEIEALPFTDGSFDVVIAAAALHYAVDLGRALTELGRVLRHGGGLLIVDSPVYADALARHRAWRRTVDYYRRADAEHVAHRYRGLTRAELDRCPGFRFVTLTPGFSPWRAALDQIRGREPASRMPVLAGFRR